MEEKVSIIVPVYNAEKYIERCLDSLINQTYSNIEIILVNDGSTDDSKEIMEKIQIQDSRIILINKENEGVSESRNIAINKSTGKYIMFVDVDDWIEKNMVQEMVSLIKEQDVDVVRCNFFRNYKNNEQEKSYMYDKDIVDVKLEKRDILDKILLQIINGKMPAYMWLLIIRKDRLEKIKKLNSNLHIMEDTMFYIDMLFKIDTLYISNKFLYHYFYNMSSASHSKENYLRNLKDILKVNKLEKRYFTSNRYDIFKEIDTTHTRMIENICYNLYKNTSRKDLMEKYEYLVNLNELKLIVNNARLKEIPLNKRIGVKYIKDKQCKKLYYYYTFMNFLSKIKNLLTGRKQC